MSPTRITIGVSSFLLVATTMADWPQWRGPNRDGAASGQITDKWSADGPVQLWDSEPIPSDHDGGHGSVVVANGRVYMSVVWHVGIPVETRTMDDRTLRSLNARPSKFPVELMEKIEAIRATINPRKLRGSKLIEFSKQWLKENLTEEQDQKYGGYIERRFREGRTGIPMKLLDELSAVQDKPFPSEAAFTKWLTEKGFDEFAHERIMKILPTERKEAADVIVCIDAATGKTQWKAKFDGKPVGRKASSTPCVAKGRVYATGSQAAYCVNADSGKLIWKVPLKSGGASSFLVVNDAAILLADTLTAYNAETGDVLWQQDQVRGRNASPILWNPRNARNPRKSGDKTFVICNSQKTSPPASM